MKHTLLLFTAVLSLAACKKGDETVSYTYNVTHTGDSAQVWYKDASGSLQYVPVITGRFRHSFTTSGALPAGSALIRCQLPEGHSSDSAWLSISLNGVTIASASGKGNVQVEN